MTLFLLVAGCSIPGTADGGLSGTADENPAVRIGNGYGRGMTPDPQVAVDASGNALAIWAYDDGMGINTYACRYEAASGWGNAEKIEDNERRRSVGQQIAFDSNGNAMAVWSRFDGTVLSIWANRYTAGSGWQDEELIETDDRGDAVRPQIVIDHNDNAWVVWSQHNGTTGRIYANRYEAGRGWQGAREIQSLTTGLAGHAVAAVDPMGNVVVVYTISEAGMWNIRALFYDAACGRWESEVLLEKDDTDFAREPQVACDAAGNFIAVWYQNDQIRANRYSAGNGWGEAELVGDEPGMAIKPAIACDAAGHAVVVWYQESGSGTVYNVWANRYTPGSGWGEAELLETDDAGDAGSPHVAANAAGEFVVVWSQNESRDFEPVSTIWSRRVTPGGGWEEACMLEKRIEYHRSQLPRVAIADNGAAVAVWYQTDDSGRNIWACSF